MSLSGLQDLFGTLSVGLLCILLIIEAYRLAFGKKTEEIPLAGQKSLLMIRQIHKLALPAALLLGIYMVGTVAETFTDQLVDSDRGDQLIWPPKLHSETYHRIGTLFKNPKDSPCVFNSQEEAPQEFYLDASSIGRAVLLSNKYPSKVPRVGELSYLDELTAEAWRVENALEATRASGVAKTERQKMKLNVSCGTLGRSVNALYYAAKNWSYSEENYFNELQAIQRRIDFLRSIYLVLGWLGLLVLLGGVIGALREREWSPMRRALFVSGGLILLGFASHHGWDRAEVNFNERSWGYFLTDMDLGDETPSIIEEKTSNPLLQRTPDGAAEE